MILPLSTAPLRLHPPLLNTQALRTQGVAVPAAESGAGPAAPRGAGSAVLVLIVGIMIIIIMIIL